MTIFPGKVWLEWAQAGRSTITVLEEIQISISVLSDLFEACTLFGCC